MMIVFFDITGVIHKEFITQGQTVNQGYLELPRVALGIPAVNQHVDLDILKHLRRRMSRVRNELAKTNSWLLQRDNAPAHMAICVAEFSAEKYIPLVPHPLYSPDFPPVIFGFSQK